MSAALAPSEGYEREFVAGPAPWCAGGPRHVQGAFALWVVCVLSFPSVQGRQSS